MTRPPWPRLALSLALLSLYLAPTWAQDPFAVTAPPKKVKNCTTTYVCKDGMILPTWEPQVGISNGDRFGKALVYFIFLVYFFLGVSIVSDVFMSSIEVITSKEREVKVKKPTGETFTITVRIWNETVSNLTLMALGSSAPEILLSIIEIIGNNFRAGDLGPNTIVGSAAFNLFMIIAICVWVVPSSEVRRQQHPHVFMVTATWSVFAYIWLYIIISVSTPRVVDIWEGVLTFAFFPLTVLTAWLADRRIFPGKAFARKIGLTRGSLGPRLSVVDGDIEMNAAGAAQTQPGGSVISGINNVSQFGGFADDKTPEVVQFEKTRQEFMRVFRELRKSHPDTPIDQLQQMAEYEMVNKGPKSRAFYRVQATRKLVGGGNIVKKKLEKEHKKHEIEDVEEELHVKYTTQVSFDPGHYTVLENVGTFNVTVTRTGGPQDTTILVDYRTEDGTADAGSDYIEAKGTLTLHPGDQHATIPVTIMDDDVFEEDEHFYMHLENLRVQTKDGLIIDPTKLGGMPMAELSVPATATIMILDDDHAGVFEFEQPEMEVTESVGTLHLKVARRSGARGKVIIPYTIKEGTATNAVHFTTDLEGELTFENDDIEQFISIPIHDAQEYEKDEHFEIELKDPIWTKKLTDHHKLYQRMKRSAERKATLQASRNTLSSVGSGERRPSMQKIMSMMQKVNEFLQGGSDESEWPEDESDADRTSQKSGDNSASLGVPGGAMEAKALEEAQIAELGRPRLGEVPEIKIRIRESKEFKGIVDRMLNVSHTAVLGTSSWKEQFIEAVTVSAGDDDDDDEEGEEGDDGEKEEKVPSFGDYVMHFLTVPWKVFFAIIPPTDYFGGWGCFVCSILMIGLLTAFIGDLASHFGCTIGLKDAVTAISFVALGTSVPDTFASKVAAIQDKYADSSIGNVTGSNAVNVFLGIGIAWTMAAVYHAAVGTPGGFIVDPGTLAYSVVIFCTEAVACIGVITLRRIPAVGGELGGPLKFKIPTVIFMVSLWCIYIIMSALESYCIVEGF